MGRRQWDLLNRVMQPIKQEMFGVPAFGVEPAGIWGGDSAVLQRMPEATTGNGHAVPRVYRGLECLASTDPGLVRGARCRKAAWFGENGWPADWEAFGIDPIAANQT